MENSWPSIVFIYFYYRAIINVNNQARIISQSSTCGGTLLDKTTVVTAAHCILNRISYRDPGTNQMNYYTVVPNSFHPTYGSMYSVFLGIHGRPSSPSGGLKVAHVIKHEDYDDINTLNDIAILKLTNNAVLGKTVQVACLPPLSNFYPRPERTIYAGGWGTLSVGGSLANTLMDVELTIYDPKHCLNVDRGSRKDFNSQICAGDLSGQRDTCQG